MSTREIGGTAARRPAWIDLLLAVVPVVVVSLAGSALTVPEIAGWYAGLAKPSFNPPNWLFGPVWTLLFALMALAAFRVWRLPAGAPGRGEALLAYHVQLVLNLSWSAAFFAANSPAAGLAVIAVLIAAILWTISAFLRAGARLSAALFLPYLAWVAFAAVLNGTIWWLNS
ncbi:TspO/MBR family protein [Bosea sp. TWI1241]|uniref:TspO/MBR family protein n=1 Tax=Bosea sp. TWI1241 TaxID=3148904 RepID=UPI0032089B24